MSPGDAKIKVPATIDKNGDEQHIFAQRFVDGRSYS
jgi:hypothetical protein